MPVQLLFLNVLLGITSATASGYLTQVIEEPMRRSALLDLIILINIEGITGDVKVEGSLHYRDTI